MKWIFGLDPDLYIELPLNVTNTAFPSLRQKVPLLKSVQQTREIRLTCKLHSHWSRPVRD